MFPLTTAPYRLLVLSVQLCGRVASKGSSLVVCSLFTAWPENCYEFLTCTGARICSSLQDASNVSPIKNINLSSDKPGGYF